MYIQYDQGQINIGNMCEPLSLLWPHQKAQFRKTEKRGKKKTPRNILNMVHFHNNIAHCPTQCFTK